MIKGHNENTPYFDLVNAKVIR